MEATYKRSRRRGRLMIALGLVLATAAAGAGFVMLSQAQQQARENDVPKVAVVVAAHAIPARKTIDSSDVAVHLLPADVATASGAYTDPSRIIGHVSAIGIFEGQPIGANLLASSTGTGGIAVLGPDEVVTANSPVWRAVALSVPDDRALGGLLEVGQTVDIFVTVPIDVPQDVQTTGKYYADHSTKVTYQNVTILAKSNAYYIIKVTQPIAEEIAHLEASGSALFSFALRPDIDTRITDATKMGETTNMIVQRYGIPVPEAYPNSHSNVSNPAPGSPRPIPTPNPPNTGALDPSPSP